jgi:hypothetical protein
MQVEREDVDCTELAEDITHLQDIVKMLMEFRVP